MASKLNVYNLAFAHLSEPTYPALTDDPLPPNIAKANAQWDQALDSALARAAWLCCTESRLLPMDTPPAQGWGDYRYANRFTCPAGTLKVWSVEGYADDAWQVGTAVGAGGAVTRIIKANMGGPLRADLVMRRPVEALTPLLVDALGLLLASRLAGPIQQNEGKASRLAKEAKEAFLMAEGAEASEIGGQAPSFGHGELNRARASAL